MSKLRHESSKKYIKTYFTVIVIQKIVSHFTELVSNASLLEALDKQFEKYAPIVFQYERNTETSRLASKDFRKFYFGSKSIDNSSLPQLAQFFADALTGISVNRGARLFAEKMKEKPIYYYKFSYKGRYSHFYLPDSNGTVPYGKFFFKYME